MGVSSFNMKLKSSWSNTMKSLTLSLFFNNICSFLLSLRIVAALQESHYKTSQGFPFWTRWYFSWDDPISVTKVLWFPHQKSVVFCPKLFEESHLWCYSLYLLIQPFLQQSQTISSTRTSTSSFQPPGVLVCSFSNSLRISWMSCLFCDKVRFRFENSINTYLYWHFKIGFVIINNSNSNNNNTNTIIPALCTLISNVKDSIVCSGFWESISHSKEVLYCSYGYLLLLVVKKPHNL